MKKKLTTIWLGRGLGSPFKWTFLLTFLNDSLPLASRLEGMAVQFSDTKTFQPRVPHSRVSSPALSASSARRRAVWWREGRREARSPGAAPAPAVPGCPSCPACSSGTSSWPAVFASETPERHDEAIRPNEKDWSSIFIVGRFTWPLEGTKCAQAQTEGTKNVPICFSLLCEMKNYNVIRFRNRVRNTHTPLHLTQETGFSKKASHENWYQQMHSNKASRAPIDGRNKRTQTSSLQWRSIKCVIMENLFLLRPSQRSHKQPSSSTLAGQWQWQAWTYTSCGVLKDLPWKKLCKSAQNWVFLGLPWTYSLTK